jgi:hypothetical protein
MARWTRKHLRTHQLKVSLLLLLLSIPTAFALQQSSKTSFLHGTIWLNLGKLCMTTSSNCIMTHIWTASTTNLDDDKETNVDGNEETNEDNDKERNSTVTRTNNHRRVHLSTLTTTKKQILMMTKKQMLTTTKKGRRVQTKSMMQEDNILTRVVSGKSGRGLPFSSSCSNQAFSTFCFPDNSIYYYKPRLLFLLTFHSTFGAAVVFKLTIKLSHYLSRNNTSICHCINTNRQSTK